MKEYFLTSSTAKNKLNSLEKEKFCSISMNDLKNNDYILIGCQNETAADEIREKINKYCKLITVQEEISDFTLSATELSKYNNNFVHIENRK